MLLKYILRSYGICTYFGNDLKIQLQKLFLRLCEFSKAAEYKINIQKSVTFLYTNNEQSEGEIEKTVPALAK